MERDDGPVGIGVVGIDHVQLTMPLRGETAARRFYESILGLRPRPVSTTYLDAAETG